MALLKGIVSLGALPAIVVAAAGIDAGTSARAKTNDIFLSEVGRYFSNEGAEITTYDRRTRQLFVAAGDRVEVIDIANPSAPQHVGFLEHEATSVAVRNGVLAIAVPNSDEDLNGHVHFYRTNDLDSSFMYEVGNLPDMLTFTPNGKTVVGANEGEPRTTRTRRTP